MVSLAALSGVQLTGCAEPPRKAADGRYCYHAKTHSGSRPTCTPGAVPDLTADAQAKQFVPVPDKLVVYVVRNRWGDAVNVVNLAFDGGSLVSTTPASLVRFVLTPGTHRLAFEWKKGRGDLEFRGEAGQVLFVDLVGSLWFWGESYRMEIGGPALRDKALKSRLVADVNPGETK
ncbi:hypothetical protein EXH51_24320 [Pelomonas saccharophila]|nr:hypothetical protein [Roseateles sp.]MDG0835853.1 hypothetical protein [Roseateles saccharophilus]